MKPPAPDLRVQTLQWAKVLRDDWEECRTDPAHAPGKAWSLLAAWGALCRIFSSETLPAEGVAVGALIRQDATELLHVLAEAPAPGAWVEKAADLDSAWDYATQEEEVRELEFAAVTLFDELDRHSLVSCMADQLASDGAIPEHVRARHHQLDRAEEWFRDHVTAFLPAVPLAGAVFAVCRPGLEEDEALWHTVLKHHLLEEAGEELAEGPATPQLDSYDLWAFRKKVRSTRVVEVRRTAQPLLDWPRYASIAAAPLPSGWPSYECQGPQQGYKAMFDLAHPDLQSKVVVSFYRNGRHTGDLAGTTARLRGVAGIIDGQGKAEFRRSELENESGPLRLEVGDPPSVWPMLTEFT